MTPFQIQFDILKASYSQAACQTLPSGAICVVIPDFQVSEGWSHEKVTLRFLAPVGYPFAKPDCFWVDLDFRLANGNMPKNSQIQAIPELGEKYLWFSWHIGPWNPNRDNLSTFIHVIQNRFKETQ